MNNIGLQSATVSMLTTLCTTLLSLFGQTGVATFGDITPVSYASAVIGGLLAGLLSYKARMGDKPE